MNAIVKLPTLKQAQADHHAAMEARTRMADRLKVADATLGAAKTVRDALVVKMAAGGAVEAQESRLAEQSIRDAEMDRAIIVDALDVPVAAVAAADRKLLLLNKIEWQHEYVRAAENRIALAEEADKFGADLTAWLTRWLANDDEFNAAWSHVNGPAPLPHELEAMRAPIDRALFIPPALQQLIVRYGTVNHGSVASRARVNWSSGLQQARTRIAGFEEELAAAAAPKPVASG